MTGETSDYSTDYSIKIGRYLDAHHIDFHQLARMACLPETAIRDLVLGYEHEIYNIDIDVLFKVLKCMNYSIFELFGEEDHMLDYQDDFLARIIIHLRENNLIVSVFEDIVGWGEIDYLYMRNAKKLICLQMIVDVCDVLKINWIQILYAIYRFEETE